MLGIFASLLLSVLPAMPSPAGVTCADEPASHDDAWAGERAQRDGDAWPRDYATPAEVDCPTPAAGYAAPECDQTPPPDLWYRVSRSPEDERSGATLSAGRRGHAGRTAVSSGVSPRDHGTVTAPHAQQPLALGALPSLELDGNAVLIPSDAFALLGRTLAPPERPPRV